MRTKPNTFNHIESDSSRPGSALSTSSTTSSISIPELFSKSNITQAKLEETFAKAIFSMNIPLNCVNNPEFIEFLGLMRPSFKIPSRTKLSTTLLEREYEKVC